MSDHKRLAALEARIKKLESQLGSKGKAINQIQFEETTEKVGDSIRMAYDMVSQAKQDAIRHKAPKETFDALNQARKEVPQKYAISKESMLELNNLLNSLAGVNSS